MISITRIGIGLLVLSLVVTPSFAQRRSLAPAKSKQRPWSAARTASDQGPFGPGTALSVSKISNDVGGFPDTLDTFDFFGTAMASLGDLDGDGIDDLAVGATGDRHGGVSHGALWIAFMQADGVVRDYQRIRENEAGFDGVFTSPGDDFALAVACIGDVDGDGVVDIAVSFRPNSRTSPERGCWILFLRRDGTVKGHQKISATEGGFDASALSSADSFGSGLGSLGDLDVDGTPDLLIGAPADSQGGGSGGAVHVVFLHPDGTVKDQRKIAENRGGFTGTLGPDDEFGRALGTLGDLDGDGTQEIAVGAPGDTSENGAVWILFLRPDGTVRSQQRIVDTLGGPGLLRFGRALTRLADRSGDGLAELAVGTNRLGGGAVQILRLRADGTDVSRTEIPFTSFGPFNTSQQFGISLASLGDPDGDGDEDLAVGDTWAFNRTGSFWSVLLTPADGVQGGVRVDDLEGGLQSTLQNGNGFGRAVAALGDLDGDGVGDIAVGSNRFESSRGTVWVQFLNSDGTVKAYQPISANEGGSLPLEVNEQFGVALAPLGDLDGDGLRDLAVGARAAGNESSGSAWLLFLRADGTVRDYRRITSPAGMGTGERFGNSLACLGDLDGDGVPELAVGAPRDDDGGSLSGAVWVLFLESDGAVRSTQKLSDLAGGLQGRIDAGDQFGESLAALDDLDGDGVLDLAVGASQDDDGRLNGGAIWVLFLRPNATVRAFQKISRLEGDLNGLEDGDKLGLALNAAGDLDGNGSTDLFVGNPRLPGDGLPDDGWVRILLLDSDGTVLAQERLRPGEGGLSEELDITRDFGSSVASLRDFDGDGVCDLIVGDPGDSDGGAGHGAIWLLSLDGIATFGFEGGDDVNRTPLVNGQEISSAPELGRTLEIEWFGPNRGPATFDSTPLGPNAASQDPDLLVDLGNVLILQDSFHPTQSTPGIFDQPNDDRDGGVFVISFRAPVECHSLDLVDIELGTGEFATVTLVDDAGRMRSYSAPAGWTGDVAVDGPPGYRTMDLRTLEPQPGFASTSTAFENPEFEARGVVRLEVQLGRSGAIDNLRWDPHPDGPSTTEQISLPR